jgi:hypothetical protein
VSNGTTFEPLSENPEDSPKPFSMRNVKNTTNTELLFVKPGKERYVGLSEASSINIFVSFFTFQRIVIEEPYNGPPIRQVPSLATLNQTAHGLYSSASSSVLTDYVVFVFVCFCFGCAVWYKGNLHKGTIVGLPSITKITYRIRLKDGEEITVPDTDVVRFISDFFFAFSHSSNAPRFIFSLFQYYESTEAPPKTPLIIRSSSAMRSPDVVENISTPSKRPSTATTATPTLEPPTKKQALQGFVSLLKKRKKKSNPENNSILFWFSFLLSFVPDSELSAGPGATAIPVPLEAPPALTSPNVGRILPTMGPPPPLSLPILPISESNLQTVIRLLYLLEKKTIICGAIKELNDQAEEIVITPFFCFCSVLIFCVFISLGKARSWQRTSESSTHGWFSNWTNSIENLKNDCQCCNYIENK